MFDIGAGPHAEDDDSPESQAQQEQGKQSVGVAALEHDYRQDETAEGLDQRQYQVSTHFKPYPDGGATPTRLRTILSEAFMCGGLSWARLTPSRRFISRYRWKLPGERR